ncbi:MAG: zinc metallopeptidase [Alistipes sp.]|nr:zinc metallopeptidase [Alistipes sp.]
MYILQVDTVALASSDVLAGEGSMAMPIVLMVLIAVVGYAVQARLRSVMQMCSKLPSPQNLTGAEVALKMLHAHGIYNVQVTRVRGHLTDHFNPETLTINLSDSVYSERSVAAMAVACHECGHAVQYVTGYNALRLRSRLVPVVNFSSRVAPWVIMLGLALMAATNNAMLCWLGILLVSVAALFAIVTLPVEYNASARALEWLESRELLVGKDLDGARLSLRWAARTYLVSALSAIATVIYYVVLISRRK